MLERMTSRMRSSRSTRRFGDPRTIAVKRSMNESPGLGCDELVDPGCDAATGVMLEARATGVRRSRCPILYFGSPGLLPEAIITGKDARVCHESVPEV